MERNEKAVNPSIVITSLCGVVPAAGAVGLRLLIEDAQSTQTSLDLLVPPDLAEKLAQGISTALSRLLDVH